MSDLARVPHWKRISRAVLVRDAHTCGICGLPGADTVDHIIPRARGGDHTPGNLRAAHRVCNSRRGAARQGLPHAAPSRW